MQRETPEYYIEKGANELMKEETKLESEQEIEEVTKGKVEKKEEQENELQELEEEAEEEYEENDEEDEKEVERGDEAEEEGSEGNEREEGEETKSRAFKLDIFGLLIALLMLMIALFLDLAGFILFIASFFGIGIPFSFLLDFIGICTIGVWYFLRNRDFLASQNNPFKKFIFNKVNLKFGSFLGLEATPFIGDFFTSWTILVSWEIINMIFFE